MTNKKKGFIILLIYIFIFFIINDFVFIPISQYIINHFNLSNNARIIYSSIYNFVVYFIGFIPIFLLYYKDISLRYTDIKEKRVKIIENVLLGFLLYYLFSMLASLLSKLLVGDMVSTNQESIEVMVKNKGIHTIFNLIAICFLGPIVEELVFRESLYNITNNNILFLILSSLLFTLIHITSSSGSFKYMIGISIPYLFGGLALGIMYIRGNHNVIVTIGIHIIINLIAMLQILAY